MRNYSSAAARLMPETEIGERAFPLAQTRIFFRGQRMPQPAAPNSAKEIATARRITEYVAYLQSHKEMELLRVEMDALRKQTALVMGTQVRLTERSVEVSVLTKSASLIVLLVCGLSLVVGFLSGFNAIHPSVALLLGVAAVVFFVMGALLAKESARNG